MKKLLFLPFLLMSACVSDEALNEMKGNWDRDVEYWWNPVLTKVGILKSKEGRKIVVLRAFPSIEGKYDYLKNIFLADTFVALEKEHSQKSYNKIISRLAQHQACLMLWLDLRFTQI